MTYYHTLIRKASMKKRPTISVGENMEIPELRYIADNNGKLYNRFGRQLGSFLQS